MNDKNKKDLEEERSWIEKFYKDIFPGNEGSRNQSRYFMTEIVSHLNSDLVRLLNGNNIWVLDYGCAAGHGMEIFKKAFPYSVMTGMDACEIPINEAKTLFPDMHFYHSPYGVVPDMYDVTICSHILEHYSEPLDMLSHVLAQTRMYCIVLSPYNEYPLYEHSRCVINENTFPSFIDNFDLVKTDIIQVDNFLGKAKMILHQYKRRRTTGTLNNLAEFSKRLSILTPWTERNKVIDDGRRQKIWSWIKRRYELLLPHAEICLGAYEEQPFSTGRALNKAYNMSDKNRPYLLINGSDITFDSYQFQVVSDLLDSDQVSYVIPFCRGIYLSKEFTDDVLLKEFPGVNIRELWDEKMYPPYLWGYCHPNTGSAYGVYFTRRSCWEEIGGYDERFVGWGFEDRANGIVVETIYKDRIVYLSYDNLWHLYHTHVFNYGPVLDATVALKDEYEKYYGNKEAMMSYINSVKRR